MSITVAVKLLELVGSPGEFVAADLAVAVEVEDPDQQRAAAGFGRATATRPVARSAGSGRFGAALGGRPRRHRGQEFLFGDGFAFLLLQAASQESEQSQGVLRKFLCRQFSVLVMVEPVEELLASSLFIGPLLLAAVTGPAAILLSSADLLPAVHRGEIFSGEPILAELLEVAGDAWTGLLGKFFGSQLAVPVAVKSFEGSRRDGVDSPLLSRLGLAGGAGLEIREELLSREPLVVVAVCDAQQSTKPAVKSGLTKNKKKIVKKKEISS